MGAISLPGGADWYAAALKLNTTTDLTAEQIHRIGLAEVKRIEGEQDALARQAGFKDRAGLLCRSRAPLSRPSRGPTRRAPNICASANEAIARNRTLLPKYFDQLPEHRIEVVREPSFSEVAGGAAHAAAPSPDGARPGRVYVHLLGVDSDDPRPTRSST